MSGARPRGRAALVWGVLAALVLMIVALEIADRLHDEHSIDDGHGHGQNTSRMLLTLPLEHVEAIEIVHAGAVHRFERDRQRYWFYHGAHGVADVPHEHVPDAAISERIDKAFQGFARTRLEREFPITQGVQQYGLAAPGTLVLVYQTQAGAPMLHLAVGDLAPDGVSRYVLPSGSRSIRTIADYQIENLVSLVGALRDRGSHTTTGGG